MERGRPLEFRDINFCSPWLKKLTVRKLGDNSPAKLYLAKKEVQGPFSNVTCWALHSHLFESVFLHGARWYPCRAVLKLLSSSYGSSERDSPPPLSVLLSARGRVPWFFANMVFSVSGVCLVSSIYSLLLHFSSFSGQVPPSIRLFLSLLLEYEDTQEYVKLLVQNWIWRSFSC